METGQIIAYIAPIGMIALLGVWYWNYFRKVKAAGGLQAFGQQLWAQQFGLAPGETVGAMWGGQFYLGPLVPGSAPSTGEQIVNALTNTSVRGANLMLALTSHNRLVIAHEPPDEGATAHKLKAMTGTHGYFMPYAQFTNAPAPRILPAAQAFPNSPHLPRPDQAPERVNMQGNTVTMQLAQLVAPSGQALTFWCEPEGLQAIWAWSQAGGGAGVPMSAGAMRGGM